MRISCTCSLWLSLKLRNKVVMKELIQYLSFIQYISLYWKSFSMNVWFVMLSCVSWLFLASPEDEAIKLQRRTSYLMATAKDRDSHKLSLDKTLSPSQSQTEIHLQWVPLWSYWIIQTLSHISPELLFRIFN